MKKKHLKVLVVIIIIYAGITFIFNGGRMYQRKSFSATSIEESKIADTFIDSFYFDRLNDFEIWRCYLKFVDYYGFGNLYAHKYISEDSCFYIALRYKGKFYKNLRFNTINAPNHGFGFDITGNGDLWTKKFRKHDSTFIRIYSQPGDTSSFYMVDSVFVKW